MSASKAQQPMLVDKILISHLLYRDGLEYRPVNLVALREQLLALAGRVTALEGGASLLPTSYDAPKQGGSSQFNVIVSGTATPAWEAQPDETWLAVTAPTGPTQGNGTVAYNVEQNRAGTARSANIVVDALGLSFPVHQAG